MRIRFIVSLSTLTFCAAQLGLAQEFIDNVDDHLKFNAFNGFVAGKFSGLLDLEQYYVQQPAPGLLYTNNSFLFSPRLTVNLDMQIGNQFYFFAQGSASRGYDPGSFKGGQVREDQYALRYTPFEKNLINFQVGQFATIVGNWNSRHDSWDNPFITAPNVYENLGGIYDSQAGPNGPVINSWLIPDKTQQIPIVWGPAYTTGASVFGSVDQFDYAAEFKNASLSSRPQSWSRNATGFDNPTYSLRLGYRPSEDWNLGLSSSYGSYLKPSAESNLVPGQGLSDYNQITIAQDASYAWHHLQIWAECYETRYQVPTVANLDTVAYYIEAKYKFTPQFFGALRWNQQFYNTIPDGSGGTTTWGAQQERIDVAGTYRFTPHTQVKLQYSYILQDSPVTEHNNFLAGQMTLRF